MAAVAWEDSIRALKAFRQARSDNAYGRSNWPEPDFIRSITGYTGEAKENNEPVHGEPLIEKFPRAAFGLPIVFEFKDHVPDDKESDPYKTSLIGNKVKRLASPLIIRPFVCSDGGCLGLATVLVGPRAWNLWGGMALQKGTEADGEILRRDLDGKLDEDENQEQSRIAAVHDYYDDGEDVSRSFLAYFRSER